MKGIALPPKLARYFEDYSAHHKTRGNKACHYVGVPTITLATLGLLARLQFGPELGILRLDGGILLWALAMLWHLTLDWKLTAPYALCTLGMYFLGRAIPVPALLVILAVGLVAQFVGHAVYEKKQPAFAKNLEHILIGPYWIFARLIGYTR